jgi:predicted nucleic acid-binding protein
MEKIVIDTNVFISAILGKNGSYARLIIEAVKHRLRFRKRRCRSRRRRRPRNDTTEKRRATRK